MDWFTWGGLVLAALVGYLGVSVGRRVCAQGRAAWARQRAMERQFPHSGFDASAITLQVQRVRADYLSAVHRRSGGALYRAGLVAAARRFVASLSSLRGARQELEGEKREC